MTARDAVDRTGYIYFLVDPRIPRYETCAHIFGLSYQDFYHSELNEFGHQRLLCIAEQKIAFDYVPACAPWYFSRQAEDPAISMQFHALFARQSCCFQVSG